MVVLLPFVLAVWVALPTMCFVLLPTLANFSIGSFSVRETYRNIFDRLHLSGGDLSHFFDRPLLKG